MPLHALVIHSIVQQTQDTKSFFLRGALANITYKPGQFLTLLHPHFPHTRRSYSLSSHPSLDELLRITVKRIPNGEYSRWLFDHALPGDEIQTIGASGFFTLPQHLSDDATLLFLAAGSGITPIFSLIREVLHFRTQRVILFYSNRSEADTLFFKELVELQNQFSERLVIEFLFSTSKNLLRARLSKSLLAELLTLHIADKSKTLAYLCGPRDYMQMALITLMNESFILESIKTELFNAEKPKVKELPPDTDEHEVVLAYAGKEFKLIVKYPDTILQRAKQQGIDLPYSCEAGRCGTCAATCVKGKVWMSRNEVLLDKEVNDGRVLTCTAYPVGGNVEIIVK